jgi:hypothetical protein
MKSPSFPRKRESSGINKYAVGFALLRKNY